MRNETTTKLVRRQFEQAAVAAFEVADNNSDTARMKLITFAQELIRQIRGPRETSNILLEEVANWLIIGKDEARERISCYVSHPFRCFIREGAHQGLFDPTGEDAMHKTLLLQFYDMLYAMLYTNGASPLMEAPMKTVMHPFETALQRMLVKHSAPRRNRNVKDRGRGRTPGTTRGT